MGAPHPTGVVPVAAQYPLERRTIPALLDHAAQTWPDRAALREGDRILDYRALREAVRSRAAAIRALGIGFQEPCAFMLDNTLDHVLTWLGVTYSGRIQVQVNTAYRGRLLVNALTLADVDTLFVEDSYCERIVAVADELPALRRLIVRGTDYEPSVAERFEVVSFDEAIASTAAATYEPDADVLPGHTYGIMFTSGTTGPSKGVVLPHALPFGYVSPETVALVDADDVVLVPFPQFHISGQWTGVLAPLMVGGCAVLVERFSTSSFWDDINHYGITQTTLLSVMVPFLLGQPETPEDATSTLAKVVMAPVIARAAEFSERFGVKIASCYGQTEACLPVVAWYGHAQPGACGWPRPEFEVRIVDEHDVDVPEGEVGELIVRPAEPYLCMTEYAAAPAATVAKWRNLWLHTGDLHRRDAFGQHYFVDRSNDAIRRRGENISSLEVEAEIQQLDGVQMVAVVGIASESEQEVKACIVSEPGHDRSDDFAREICLALRERLPYFMVPRYIEFYDDLPRTPTQRIQKSELRQAGVAGSWDARAHGLEATRHDR